jgi:hypothetical protein
MTGAARSAERLGECPGFVTFWTAATVSGFGTYVTTLAIQVLVVVTLHEGAAASGWSVQHAGSPFSCSD